MESDREGSKRGGLCTVTTPTGQQKQSHKILTKGVTKQNHLNIKILQMPPMTSSTFFFLFFFFEHRYLWYMNSVILWKKNNNNHNSSTELWNKSDNNNKKEKDEMKTNTPFKKFSKKRKKEKKREIFHILPIHFTKENNWTKYYQTEELTWKCDIMATWYRSPKCKTPNVWNIQWETQMAKGKRHFKNSQTGNKWIQKSQL